MANFIYYKAVNLNNIESVRIVKINEFSSIAKVYGRKVLINGNLKDTQEGNNIFIKGKFEPKIDYLKGTLGIFYADEVKEGKNDFLSSLYDLKRKTFNKFNQHLTKEKSALVMSLCFGDTSYLNEDQKNNFKQLGVIHAISVSGFHMAVIYKILERFLGIEGSIVVSLLYVIFTGTQPATVRAFLMIFILKLSKKVYKNYDNLSALSLSAILIIIIEPFYAVDIGFVLSYLSTLGIILYYNKIRRFLHKLPNTINESLSLTLSAQVFSMPYAGMTIGNLSFGFLAGNLILLPIYTALVITGNAALIVLNFEFIFSLICKLINIITITLDGADYILLKITPKVSEVSYIDCIALLCLVISFILVKRGFNKFKYMPLFVLGMILIQSYNFFPKIEYVDLKFNDGVIISYKYEKILICSKEIKNTNDLKKLKYTRLIPELKENIIINLGRNYSVKAFSLKNDKNKSINLEVSAHDSNIILTRNSEEFMDIDLKKYDIIRVPKKTYFTSNKSFNSNSELKEYRIIFDKIYTLN
ncbi:ComEC/Rec2 family competence protein [Clostridium sp. YIM B02515]|uniref:ComEC/Rec2 family competence protein n=2 Tax=Clostridium rhizosphaerae TaxID=2803861 RepID=A0ABS1T7D7_9CLOT|nr:ComEC/Rec2 family competence protein [Clostridium rhizosphaerae]